MTNEHLTCDHILIGPYYKSELELKSNSSEILPVNCKIICIRLQLKLTKLKLEFLKSDIQRKKEIYEHMQINL